MSSEISHEITEEDIKNYNKAGFVGRGGRLKRVEDDSQIYSSWSDIRKFTSPWSQFLVYPYEWHEYLVRHQQEKSDNLYRWLENEKNRKLKIQKILDNSERFEIEIPIWQKNIKPMTIFSAIDDPEHPAILLIGEAINVRDVERNKVLEIANSQAWGREGGLQSFADVLGKPLLAVPNFSKLLGLDLSQEFLPRLN